MMRKHLELGELAARTQAIYVIENNKVVVTTLYEHVMKSSKDGPWSYAHVRDNWFLRDASRDTSYWLNRHEAENAFFLAEGQAKDL